MLWKTLYFTKMLRKGKQIESFVQWECMEEYKGCNDFFTFQRRLKSRQVHHVDSSDEMRIISKPNKYDGLQNIIG